VAEDKPPAEKPVEAPKPLPTKAAPILVKKMEYSENAGNVKKDD